MKKAEWERRIELDLEGVELLGAALTLQARRTKERYERELESARENGMEFFGFDPPFDIKKYERGFESSRQIYEDLLRRTQELLTPSAAFEKAVNLRVMDFRFRWDHFRDHLILVGYVTDDVPHYAEAWGRNVPIAEIWHTDYVTEALRDIFEAERERVTSPDPDILPDLNTREDFLFYLTVWQYCEPERSKGHPAGRRWPDGLEHAVSYAYSIREDAKDTGEPISNDEAIRRALKEFDLVSPDEFLDHPDKESTVVTASGTPGDRLEGVLKAVRKRLKYYDDRERS